MWKAAAICDWPDPWTHLVIALTAVVVVVVILILVVVRRSPGVASEKSWVVSLGCELSF
jgi:hypothetical protein